MTRVHIRESDSRNLQLRPRHAVTRTLDHIMMCLQQDSIPYFPISNLGKTDLFIKYVSTVLHSTNM